MGDKIRHSKINRETTETKIDLNLILDGTGQANIDTGIPFFNHMLSLFARHGLFDLQIIAKGDIEIDAHHTVEDVGICLGKALKEALGDKMGIRRYGDCLTPMDESLSRIAIDISGRSYLNYNIDFPKELIERFDPSLIHEFLKSFVNHGEITVHVELLNWENIHHAIESIFKGLGRALDVATSIDERQESVPSTKGEI